MQKLRKSFKERQRKTPKGQRTLPVLLSLAIIATIFLVRPASVSAQDSSANYTIHGTGISVSLNVEITAGELFDQCQFDAEQPGPDAFICVGYITGARDAMEVIWAANSMPSAFCIPSGTPRRVFLESFINQMTDAPERRGLPGSLVVLQGLRTRFPCPPAE